MITQQEVIEAQKEWANAIVNVGKTFVEGGDYVTVAHDLIDHLYAYDEGTVLFKPTKASSDQFRGTEKEALSYFVKGLIDEDHGFALQPWSQVRFENEDFLLMGDYAIAMGNYFFTDAHTGKEVHVEFTFGYIRPFGYIRGKEGQLLINLHHSSLPYIAH
jgi:hypothetical protein